MKVYVDFDRTLFDCDKFLEDFYTIINKYDIPKDLFKKCQNQSRRHGFNPYVILNNLEKETSFDKEVYSDIKDLIHNTSDYLYPDAIPFLEYLHNNNYQVIILTKGNKNYQKEKIENAKIDKYYTKLIVTMRHKGLLFLNYLHGIFIDDNPRELRSLYIRKPKKIIRITRPNSKYSKEELEYNILKVNSLQEIIDNKII